MRLKKYLKLSVCLLCASLVVSCEKKQEKVLNLAIWGNYLSPELQKKFTETTGIKIRITLYSSNEELLAKVQTGSSDFDVAVPSDYMVGVLIKLNLLEALDKNQLPNHVNIDPRYLKQNFDPQNDYSYPYAWTTTGIAYQKKADLPPIKSWKDLFENPALKGQISALDDMRELAAVALKMQKHSVNTTNQIEIVEAFSYLKKVKPQVKVFTANAVDLLKNKELKAGHVYSTDALMAQKENPDIEFILPEEGSTKALDNLVIIKKAPHRQEAHAFINFLMTTEASLSSVENLRAGPVIKGVREKLPPALRNHPALFPDEKRLAGLESIVDLGEKNLIFENSWVDFKAH